jgi:hypothetical protein
VDRICDAILRAFELAKPGEHAAKVAANYRASASSTAMPTSARGRGF